MEKPKSSKRGIDEPRGLDKFGFFAESPSDPAITESYTKRRKPRHSKRKVREEYEIDPQEDSIENKEANVIVGSSQTFDCFPGTRNF
jgi:hypothetical protein